MLELPGDRAPVGLPLPVVAGEMQASGSGTGGRAVRKARRDPEVFQGVVWEQVVALVVLRK